MTLFSAEQIPQQLEKTFKKIQTERMAGVPVINNKLNVKATNFQPWEDHQLGILISPWFMNIVLLPLENNWQNLKIGQEIVHTFPSGKYLFTVGYEKGIGYYQSCSLFSPMFEFANQKAAEATAQAALMALFDQSHEDIESQHPAEKIAKIWKGEAPFPKPQNSFDDMPSHERKTALRNSKPLKEKLRSPISRRDFLRGRIIHSATENGDQQG